MGDVIRRLSAVLFLAFVLAACGGENRIAVDAGGDSLTRDQLVSLTTALRSISADEVVAVSADDLRQVSSAHLVSTAYLAYLDDIEQEIPDDLRGAAQDFVADQINAGNILPITFNSVEFEAYVEILMAEELLNRLPLEEAEFFEVIGEYSDGFEVESRLGTWDESTLTIIAP